MELSNDGEDADATPRTRAVIANATVIGGDELFQTGEIAGPNGDRGVQFREGSHCRVYNSIFRDFGDAGFCVENGGTVVAANNMGSQDSAADDARKPRQPADASPCSGRGVVCQLARSVLVGLVVVAAVACGGGAVARPGLSGAQTSPESPVREALRAVSADDREALEAVLITREKSETLLWPDLPDRDYTPFEFVWSLASTNNRKGSKQALSAFQGFPLELVSVSFPEEPEAYQSFRPHPGVEVRVRRGDTAEEGTHHSFDVLGELGGQWKLLDLDEL